MRHQILKLSLTVALVSCAANATDLKSKPVTPPAPAQSLPKFKYPVDDGKVENLQSAAYAVLAQVRARAPDAYTVEGRLTATEIDALAAAIRKDGKTDFAELDLLQELTQFDIRGINVYAGAASPLAKKLLFFPITRPLNEPLMELRNEHGRKLAVQADAQPKIADPALVDGKVDGLNTESYGEFQRLKQVGRDRAFTDLDAQLLKTAMLRDKKVDDVEADLLRELTQSQFRSIAVTKEGSSTEKITTFPTSGNTKKILLEILHPPLDLAKAWTQDSAGWNNMIKTYNKDAAEQARVTNFLVGRLGEDWAASNMANGYKPLRDRIGKLYGYSNSQGSDANSGKSLLYKAMLQLDRREADKIPDFIYNWVRPEGYL